MLKLMKRVASLVLCAVTLFGALALSSLPVSAAESNSNGVMIFSKKKDGNTYLTKNFQVKEFACKDGSDTILIDPELVVVLQKIRDHFGKSVTINSAYRTASYNKKIGGAKNSNHVKGMAADIRISGVAPKEIAAYAETIGVRGIGLYETSSDGYFVHLDTRTTKSYWYGQAQKRRTTFGGYFNTKSYSGMLFNVSAPSSVKSGQSFCFSGNVISTSNIISCRGELVEINGKVRTSFTFIPKGKFCSVTHDADISPGVYTFRITAKTAEGNKSWEQLLVVSGNLKTKGLTIDGKITSSFKEGKTPTISGGISTSLLKKVKTVKIVILDNNGNVVQTKTYTPNARTAKLQTLAKNIQFSKLDSGTYTLVIAAYDSAGRIACSTQSFKVK